ncbi:MAG TPA: L,D-transpeptidase family protein [Chitinophagaceae bacterium]|nr:L,D-transpeptidase family protein [Chitinophagaceae bacterium]
MKFKSVLTATCMLILATGMAGAQSFLDQQLSNPTVEAAFQNKDSVLRKEFAAKHLEYPPRFMYIRAFKYDSQLEVWVKQNLSDTFCLFKSYRICALSGTMGPKRRQGDGQVPEGFYYISEFKPNSAFHLALGLNYPNYSDRLAGGSGDMGGDIYIHGSCVTEGCIPLTDPRIEEVYLLATYARNSGQDFIPVDIFPIRFNNKISRDYLGSLVPSVNSSRKFWVNLRNAYDYFNQTHQLPVIMYDTRGNYVIQGKFTPGASITAR